MRGRIQEEAIVRTVGVSRSGLCYSLLRTDSQRFSVSVAPDLAITVMAPAGAPLEQVDRRVWARAWWIRRQLRHFERFQPLPVPRRYVSGETHFYLGRQYRLRLAFGQDAVTLAGGRLVVACRGRQSAGRVRDLLAAWYRERAIRVLHDRRDELARRFPWLCRAEATLRVRHMRTRWGSCGPAGVITVNVDLVKAPISCIDYLLVHELCHRLELRHSRRFYSLLRRAIPDWERAREHLNAVVR